MLAPIPRPKVEDHLLSAVWDCWGRYLGLQTRWQGSGEDYITRTFLFCTPHQIPFGWSKQEEWDGWGMWNGRVMGEVHRGISLGDLKEGDH